MPNYEGVWSWIVFALSVGAFVPLGISGWQHVGEINMAAYLIWLITMSILLYSLRKKGFAGWRMPLGYVVGNAVVFVIGIFRRGKWNLTLTEDILLFGIVIALSSWVAIRKEKGGQREKQKKRRVNVLLYASVISVGGSFYPMITDYLRPNHWHPPFLMMLGWWLWILASILNLIFVDKFLERMRTEARERARFVVEASLFSIVNFVLMCYVVILMGR